jgi:hypothetical protein
MRQMLILVVLLASVAAATPAADRANLLRRAQVWNPTSVSSADLLAGPAGAGAFAPGETVSCAYIKETLTGHSPKFTCRLENGDRVKVKYGGTNGEVYGEVLATRLLTPWQRPARALRDRPVALDEAVA